MKTVYYILLCIERACCLIKKLMECAFLFSTFFELKIKGVRRGIKYQILHNHRKKKNLKNKKEKVVVQHITMQINSNAIVGGTNTTFLKESDLPQFNKAGIMHSEPLETEITDNAEHEPDIDPSDVDTNFTDAALRKLLEEENDDPALYDNSPPTEELTMATGVTVDELNETFNTLKKENYTQEEKDKAEFVLRKIEGTEFMKFYLMQNECMERAKIFMQDIEVGNQTDSPTDMVFDMGRYI